MRPFLAVSVLSVFVLLSAAVTGVGMMSSTSAEPAPTPPANTREKKNARPDDRSTTVKNAIEAERNKTARPATHFYEFVRPGFLYGHVWIEHDDEGRGTLSFLKEGYDEKITDPIALSSVTLKKLDELMTKLDFLNSSEEYQFERDLSHMGNVTFTLRRNGKERTVKYNWTDNKYAKELMDEYRRIANEYTWLFEFGIARVNQPLRTPAMMDLLDGHIRRGEISDPPHLLPYLNEVASDEKLPLIARNHASRLIKQIEKSGK